MADNVIPIRPTVGMEPLEQLRAFVTFEREQTNRVHVAEWALMEIERLQAKLSAAERETIERCAKVCAVARINTFSRDHNRGLQHAEDAIRALLTENK